MIAILDFWCAHHCTLVDIFNLNHLQIQCLTMSQTGRASWVIDCSTVIFSQIWHWNLSSGLWQILVLSEHYLPPLSKSSHFDILAQKTQPSSDVASHFIILPRQLFVLKKHGALARLSLHCSPSCWAIGLRLSVFSLNHTTLSVLSLSLDTFEQVILYIVCQQYPVLPVVSSSHCGSCCYFLLPIF